jgi:hypothetical protein
LHVILNNVPIDETIFLIIYNKFLDVHYDLQQFKVEGFSNLYLCSQSFLDEAFQKHAPKTLMRMTLYERCDDPASTMGHQQANTMEG